MKQSQTIAFALLPDRDLRLIYFVMFSLNYVVSYFHAIKSSKRNNFYKFLIHDFIAVLKLKFEGKNIDKELSNIKERSNHFIANDYFYQNDWDVFIISPMLRVLNGNESEDVRLYVPIYTNIYRFNIYRFLSDIDRNLTQKLVDKIFKKEWKCVSHNTSDDKKYSEFVKCDIDGIVVMLDKFTDDTSQALHSDLYLCKEEADPNSYLKNPPLKRFYYLNTMYISEFGTYFKSKSVEELKSKIVKVLIDRHEYCYKLAAIICNHFV